MDALEVRPGKRLCPIPLCLRAEWYIEWQCCDNDTPKHSYLAGQVGHSLNNVTLHTSPLSCRKGSGTACLTAIASYLSCSNIVVLYTNSTAWLKQALLGHIPATTAIAGNMWYTPMQDCNLQLKASNPKQEVITCLHYIVQYPHHLYPASFLFYLSSDLTLKLKAGNAHRESLCILMVQLSITQMHHFYTIFNIFCSKCAVQDVSF